MIDLEANALGERARGGRVVLQSTQECLGQQLDRRQRRAQLVRDMRHEVASHGFQPTQLRQIFDGQNQPGRFGRLAQRRVCRRGLHRRHDHMPRLPGDGARKRAFLRDAGVRRLHQHARRLVVLDDGRREAADDLIAREAKQRERRGIGEADDAGAIGGEHRPRDIIEQGLEHQEEVRGLGGCRRELLTRPRERRLRAQAPAQRPAQARPGDSGGDGGAHDRGEQQLGGLPHIHAASPRKQTAGRACGKPDS